jgi:hypothetical protein
MLVTQNIGDWTTTTTGTKAAAAVGYLESAYVTIGGAFGVGTAKVEVSFDGTNFREFGSTTSTETLIGPLPPCKLVRGNVTDHGSTGTISMRLGANKVTMNKPMVGETVSGEMEDITTGVATTTAVDLSGCGDATVWLYGTNWVGTVAAKVSFDGGSTWAIVGTPTTTEGGTTDTKITVPRGSRVKVVASVNTSGTLHVYYGARREAQM